MEEAWTPLHIDGDEELLLRRARQPRGVSKIWKYLTKKTHFKLYEEANVGRYLLERQLACRSELTLKNWRATRFSEQFVSTVLGALKEQLRWPNAYFVPDDPAPLCFIEEFDNDGCRFFFYKLRSLFSVNFAVEDLRKIFAQNWTLEQLIDDVSNRMEAVTT